VICGRDGFGGAAGERIAIAARRRVVAHRERIVTPSGRR
jgi:hypothetical protein